MGFFFCSGNCSESELSESESESELEPESELPESELPESELPEPELPVSSVSESSSSDESGKLGSDETGSLIRFFWPLLMIGFLFETENISARESSGLEYDFSLSDDETMLSSFASSSSSDSELDDELELDVSDSEEPFFSYVVAESFEATKSAWVCPLCLDEYPPSHGFCPT